MTKVTDLIKKLQISTKRKVFSMFVGSYLSAFKGQGIEFEDIREYVPGDNIKDIDWNSAAKTGTLYIRKYRESRELTILFCIDSSASMNFGIDVNYKKKDVALNTIFLLTQAAISNSDRFGALIFDEKIQKNIDFKKGFSHAIKIINEAEKFYTENYFRESQLKLALNALIKKIRKRTILFLFTDYVDMDDPELHSKLRVVNKKHELIIVNILDSSELNPDFSESFLAQNVATGEVDFLPWTNENFRQEYLKHIKAYQSKLADFCKRSGIGLIDLSQNSDLLVELIRYFRLQSLKH